MEDVVEIDGLGSISIFREGFRYFFKISCVRCRSEVSYFIFISFIRFFIDNIIDFFFIDEDENEVDYFDKDYLERFKSLFLNILLFVKI